MINNCEKRILYWGLPHVVFLAIASITALQVSYDFSDDSFVKVTVFIISFISLSFLYHCAKHDGLPFYHYMLHMETQ